jgi:hypothetical protein
LEERGSRLSRCPSGTDEDKDEYKDEDDVGMRAWTRTRTTMTMTTMTMTSITTIRKEDDNDWGGREDKTTRSSKCSWL